MPVFAKRSANCAVAVKKDFEGLFLWIRRTSAGGGLEKTSAARRWKSLSGALSASCSGSVSQGSCLEWAGVLA